MDCLERVLLTCLEAIDDTTRMIHEYGLGWIRFWSKDYTQQVLIIADQDSAIQYLEYTLDTCFSYTLLKCFSRDRDCHRPDGHASGSSRR